MNITEKKLKRITDEIKYIKWHLEKECPQAKQTIEWLDEFSPTVESIVRNTIRYPVSLAKISVKQLQVQSSNMATKKKAVKKTAPKKAVKKTVKTTKKVVKAKKK